MYDIKKNTWQKLKPNVKLPGLDSHCVTVLNNKMYVYGGYKPAKAESMKDIYVLDLDKMTWEKIYTSTGSDK